VINRVGWLDDRHGPSPILYDTAPLLVYSTLSIYYAIVFSFAVIFPPSKNFFFESNLLDWPRFWDIRRVARANRSGDIHPQSHIRISCFLGIAWINPAAKVLRTTALVFLMLSKNQSNGLCLHPFIMIQTCTHLYSSKYSPPWAQLGGGHGGRFPPQFQALRIWCTLSPHIFPLGFAIYWFHTNLPPTFYNKTAPMLFTKWVNKELIWKFFIGNQFQVKLHILIHNPET